MILLIIGVAGSGKTTIGKNLARKLDWSFFDSNRFHSKENIQKMSDGIPLTDEDRMPWLKKTKDFINKVYYEKNYIIECSALKQSYRNILCNSLKDIIIVYLKGSYKTVLKRLENRKESYFPLSLLKSQFETLEEPQNCILVSIEQSIQEITDKIFVEFKKKHYGK